MKNNIQLRRTNKRKNRTTTKANLSISLSTYSLYSFRVKPSFFLGVKKLVVLVAVSEGRESESHKNHMLFYIII